MLDDAISCIDLIAPEGTVAYAEDKNGNRTIIGSSDDESKVELPIVCLVNGNTASAAELFAASLRTMNGARLVGTTTMGKGTIQSSPQRLSDGSAVSITVAKLICGDGSCFDGTGLSVPSVPKRPRISTLIPPRMTRRSSVRSAQHSS